MALIVSEKGQVDIPKAVREALGIQPRSQIALDTNALARIVAADDAKQTATARALIESQTCFVSLTVRWNWNGCYAACMPRGATR